MNADDLPAGDKRRLIAELRSDGLSYREIEKRLGLCRATIAYHCRRLGVPVDEKAARRYDWTAVQRAYDSGLSVRQCAAHFGFSQASWHKAVLRGAVVARPACRPISEILVDGREVTNRGHLRERLIREGLKEAQCELCGLSKWRGRELGLQLHHRNGRKHDNRIENLQLLCPNCHAQTDNWGGRNKRRNDNAL